MNLKDIKPDPRQVDLDVFASWIDNPPSHPLHVYAEQAIAEILHLRRECEALKLKGGLGIKETTINFN